MYKPKHDYDSEEFYQELYGYAFQGAKDDEIADLLDLTPEVFSKMVNGTYSAWDDARNQEVSARIRQVLARARRKINYVVRGRYLKAALGGIKIKSKSHVTRRLRINGVLTEDEDVQTTENESETAPNMQALAMWLYHHDKEWRKIQRGLDTDEDNEGNVDQGIDIARWIQKEVSIKED